MAQIGSIEKRGDNSYRLIVSCGTDEQGKQIKKTKTVHVNAKTKEKQLIAANKLLIDFVSQVQNGLYVDPSSLTFADFTKQYIRDHAEVHVSPKVLHEYKSILNNRILGAIGHLKMDKIKPTHLLEFYAALREPGAKLGNRKGNTLSDNTILYHHRLISGILEKAVEWKVIPDNPAKVAKPVRHHKNVVQAYDEQQTKDMLEALATEDIQYIALVIMSLFTGGRRSEVLGLEWRHIDFTEGRLTFEQASQYIPNMGIKTKDTLKTESSVRSLSLPQSVLEMLQQYQQWQQERKRKKLKRKGQWFDTGRLFTKHDGTPMHPDTISKWFLKFLERHGLPHLPFKNLRHTHATLLLAQGVPLYNIGKRLGHARQDTTDNFYSKPLRRVDEDIAETLNNTLVIPNLSPKA